jgi:hypothetical protein
MFSCSCVKLPSCALVVGAEVLVVNFFGAPFFGALVEGAEVVVFNLPVLGFSVVIGAAICWMYYC